MELLIDTRLLYNIQIVGESKILGTLKLRSTIQKAGEPNGNKRIYPKSVLESQVKKLVPLVKERKIVGELDHPEGDSVKLANASHLITNVWMEGNDVKGDIELLNTPAGKVAQELVKAGVKIGISSRGTGTLKELDNGYKEVNEDYNLITFDLVADPSTKGAYPQAISESKIKQIVEQSKDKFINEKLFIQALKNKLNGLKSTNKIKEGVFSDNIKLVGDKFLIRKLDKFNRNDLVFGGKSNSDNSLMRSADTCKGVVISKGIQSEGYNSKIMDSIPVGSILYYKHFNNGCDEAKVGAKTYCLVSCYDIVGFREPKNKVKESNTDIIVKTHFLIEGKLNQVKLRKILK